MASRQLAIFDATKQHLRLCLPNVARGIRPSIRVDGKLLRPIWGPASSKFMQNTKNPAFKPFSFSKSSIFSAETAATSWQPRSKTSYVWEGNPPESPCKTWTACVRLRRCSGPVGSVCGHGPGQCSWFETNMHPKYLTATLLYVSKSADGSQDWHGTKLRQSSWVRNHCKSILSSLRQTRSSER